MDGQSEKTEKDQTDLSPSGKKPNGERVRLPRGERERMILAEAARFFAEVGFEGQTRVLAQRLGITQPLLYRYFPDKDALIDRVCHEIFTRDWEEQWSAILRDRSRRLDDRLIDIYRAYVRVRASNEGIRLFLFAALRDQQLAFGRLRRLHATLFLPLCREARAAAGRPETPVSEAEIDIAVGLHGAVSYALLHRGTLQAVDWDQFDVTIATLVGVGVEALQRLSAQE